MAAPAAPGPFAGALAADVSVVDLDQRAGGPELVTTVALEHGRRRTAAALLLFLSLFLLVLPMLVTAPHLTTQLGRGVVKVQSYFAGTPEQPAWIKSLPLIGRRAGSAWNPRCRGQGQFARVAGEPWASSFWAFSAMKAQNGRRTENGKLPNRGGPFNRPTPMDAGIADRQKQ